LRRSAPLLVAALLTLSSATAHAAAPDPAWPADHPERAAIDTLASQYNLVAIPGLWQPGELSELARAAQAVPKGLWPYVPTVKLIRKRNQCMAGIGLYNSICPTFNKSGDTFYFYDMPPFQGEGSARRLEPLTKVERERLQRRRGLIHLVFAFADKKLGWSKTRAWRAINGWKDEHEQPFNLDLWAYSRYLGLRGPHYDLVTFAEEYLVDPEEILRDSDHPTAAARLNALVPDMALACQEFTKSRILGRFIAKLDPTFALPVRGLPARPSATPEQRTPAGMCPQFNRWADMDHLEGFDILLAAATSDRPESLYGHLLMQVRYRSGEAVRSQGFEPVYQYGAITDTDVNKIDYFVKGLMGGFMSVIQPNSFRGVDRLFLQYEQRTLRHYALNLSPQQRLQVMQRIWEAERHITYPYYFMSDNCASMLLDLLEPALDVELPSPIRFALMPTEILDILASVPNGERGPLLVKRPETHFSSREVALDAVPARRDALATLIQRAQGISNKDRDALRALDARLDLRDAKARQDAYIALRALLAQVLAAHDKQPSASTSATRAAIDYLYYSSRVERYFMDVAFFRKRIIQIGAQRQQLRLSAEEQLQLRRELFREEDLESRQEAILAWARMGDERMRDGEMRPFTEAEKAELAALDRTRDAYLESLESLATIIERFDPELDGVGYIDDKLAVFEREQSRRDALAMGPAGKGRYLVGVTGGGTGTIDRPGAANALWAEISASMIWERLGEQRRRGFRSDIESRALGLDAELRLGDRPQDDMRLALNVFRFMSIEQKMGPVQESWTDLFGWGVDIRLLHDGRRDMSLGIEANLGYVYPIWTSDNVANFLVAGLYGDARFHWGALRDPNLLGARAQLIAQKHLYGRYANVLRAEAYTTHMMDVGGLGYDWELFGQLGTEHILTEINQQVLLIKPYARYEATSLNYIPGQEDQAFSAWRAGVTFELPF
jgi:hypothetical protein